MSTLKLMKKWVCVECSYVHEGDVPPDFCPVCMAPSEAFAEYRGA
ncbi:MAG: rubredoxin-like domain-containing protein [Deltaproteobacteria bacterium]